MTAESNLPNSEQFRITAKSWVDANAAADILEECKSATLSQWMAEQGDIAVNKAELTVKASERWRVYLETMVNARKRANLLKVQLEYIRMKYGELQSAEASKRAEMRI